MHIVCCAHRVGQLHTIPVKLLAVHIYTTIRVYIHTIEATTMAPTTTAATSRRERRGKERDSAVAAAIIDVVNRSSDDGINYETYPSRTAFYAPPRIGRLQRVDTPGGASRTHRGTRTYRVRDTSS